MLVISTCMGAIHSQVQSDGKDGLKCRVSAVIKSGRAGLGLVAQPPSSSPAETLKCNLISTF
jgi:hypothetical protein